MNNWELLSRASEPLRPERLIPIEQLADPDRRAQLAARFGRELPTIEAVRASAGCLGQPLDCFYLDPDGLEPICFFDGTVLQSIASLDPAFLESMQLKQILASQQAAMRRCLEKAAYRKLFRLADKRVRPHLMRVHYFSVPESERYALFREVYIRQDRGLALLGDAIVRDALSRAPRPAHLPEAGADGMITVYRGLGPDARELQQAYSWTVSFFTALYFAARFAGQSGTAEHPRILTAKVRPDQVVDYITDRGEYEVLVRPEDLAHIAETDLCDLEHLVDQLEVEGRWYQILSLYQGLAHDARVASGSLFHDADGVHGFLHARRVLLLSLLIASLSGMDDVDLTIIARAAIYHDIGREQEMEDEVHGELGAARAQALGLLSDLDPADAALVQHLITVHCLPDEIAFARLRALEPEDPGRARMLLCVLKDADGLDRVRLRDLDPSYLRLEVSRRLPLVAWLALHGIA